MKRLELFSVAAVSAIIGFAGAFFAVRPPSEQPPLETQKEVREAYFQTLDTAPEVAIVGDSITASIEWSEELPRTRVANRSISGSSALEVLARIEGLKRINAETYVIALGTNDIFRGRTPEETAQTLTQIVSKLPGKKFVLAVPPCAPNYTDCEQSKIDAVNSLIGDFDVTVIPTPITSSDLADKVHPNAPGLSKLAAAVRTALDRAENTAPE